MKESNPQYAIIVAGGVGQRMKENVPKQFLLLDGKPIIIHTLERFLQAIPSIRMIIAVHSEWEGELQSMLGKYLPTVDVTITAGGKTRFQSVKKGLESISGNNGKVAIHDAVRPFVTVAVIKSVLDQVQQNTGIIPSLPSKDSVRLLTDNGSSAMARDKIRLVQTPQCFLVSDIKEAYKMPYQKTFTDDASVFEAAGGNIELTEGNAENIKITSPMDMRLAALLLNG